MFEELDLSEHVIKLCEYAIQHSLNDQDNLVCFLFIFVQWLSFFKLKYCKLLIVNKMF